MYMHGAVGQIQVGVEVQDFGRQVALYIYRRLPNNDIIRLKTITFEWEPVEEGSVCPPSAKLSYYDLVQVLPEYLKIARAQGLLPPEPAPKPSPDVEALKAHIADLRELLRLGVEGGMRDVFVTSHPLEPR